MGLILGIIILTVKGKECRTGLLKSGSDNDLLTFFTDKCESLID